MPRFLLVLLLLPGLITAQTNPDYDPDYDGDGCFSVTDILGLLPLFGSCAPPEFSCGDPIVFDNHAYATVQIGDQCWFAENLRSAVYANGDSIPSAFSDAAWSNTSNGATSIFGENGLTCYDDSPIIDACEPNQALDAFGRLYNWPAIQDPKGVCPAGWHVPTDEEWGDLEMYLGMDPSEVYSLQWRGTDQGDQLKADFSWSEGGDGSDGVGFGVLGTGYRDYNGSYLSAGQLSMFWTSTPDGNGNGFNRYFLWNHDDILRAADASTYGYSVRCLQGAAIPGCMDPSYLEFDPVANANDGSCATPVSTSPWNCGDDLVHEAYAYQTVQIGDQCWFAENLRSAVYANGDSIPADDVVASSISACGLNYRWSTVTDERNLCPSGWTVPTDSAWMVLESTLGMESALLGASGWRGTNQGTQLKASVGWDAEGDGTNAVGFNGLPGGNGGTQNAGAYGMFWTSTGQYSRKLGFDQPGIQRGYDEAYQVFSVRCLRVDP